MTCRDVQPLAGSYLDGELPEEMCDRVARHLLRCPACRQEVDSLRMAVQVLMRTQAAPAIGEARAAAMLEALGRELELSAGGAGAPGQLVLAIRDEA